MSVYLTEMTEEESFKFIVLSQVNGDVKLAKTVIDFAGKSGVKYNLFLFHFNKITDGDMEQRIKVALENAEFAINELFQ